MSEQKFPAEDYSPGSNTRRRRVLALLLVVLATATTTYFAETQTPRPNPLTPIGGFSDWFINPIEQNAFKRLPVITNDLIGVFALPDSDLIWAVGVDGMIIHSTDGGNSWEHQNNFDWTEPARSAPAGAASLSLPGLFLREAHAEEAVNTDQADIGQDIGGDSSSEQEPLRTLTAVHFVDARHGVAVGTNGIILLTTDGGVRWQRRASNTDADLYGVLLVDGSRAVAVGTSSTLIVSDDGGEKWASRALGEKEPPDLFGIDANREGRLFTYDQAGRVYSSDGRGNFWVPRFVWVPFGYEFRDNRTRVCGGRWWSSAHRR